MLASAWLRGARDRNIPLPGSNASCRSCAEDNMQVAQHLDAGELLSCTPAPAIAIVTIRKPLILMTPKSLLRHKRCRVDGSRRCRRGHHIPSFAVGRCGASCETRSLQARASDDKHAPRRPVHRQGLLRSATRNARSAALDDIYILRVEQLYPFPLKALVATSCRRFKQGRRSCGARKSRRTWVRVGIRRALSRMGAGADRRQSQARALCRAARPRRRPLPELMSKLIKRN